MDKKPDHHFSHASLYPKLGVLLANLGSPSSPDAVGLRSFYSEFLADARVIEVPRSIWYGILYAFILPFRPRVVAQQYQNIWTEKGSPLHVYSNELGCQLNQALEEHFGVGSVKLVVGMRYGVPSIDSALAELRKARVKNLLVLPLYPQAAAATTASTFDAVSRALKSWRYVPHIRMVMGYHDEEKYIAALCRSIEQYWSQYQNDRVDVLLLSFHGVPRKTLEAGDPYHCFCLKTARLVAEKLGLEFYKEDEAFHWRNQEKEARGHGQPKFAVSFQSRFLFAETYWRK